MVYRPHILATWGGQLGVTDEIWQNSMRFVTNSTDTQELHDLASAWFEEFEAALRTLVTAAGSGYQQVAFVDWIKLNGIGADGRMLPDAQTNAWFAGDDFVRFAGTGGMGPAQLALAVSFETTRARGVASRGRLYVPCGVPSAYDNSSMRILGTYPATCAALWAAFITDLDDNPGPDFANLRAAVVSKIGDGENNYADITGVKVGRVIDTQRRRRNALDEDYSPISPVTN